MLKNSLLQAVTASLLLFGCAGSAHVRGSASVTAPDLVFISPGVQVIADYREPIFYTDSYYWRYSGNVWYRSSNYTSGWVRFQAPVAILRIERPSAYIHYRGAARGTTAVHTPQTHQERKAEQKEERKEIQAEQKEARQEAKEERKEQKAEQKEERKEQKEERKDDHKKGKR